MNTGQDLNSDLVPEFNQWTRMHDDKCWYDLQQETSQKPMKYITYDAEYKNSSCQVNIPGSLCGGVSHVGNDTVGVENELRSEMTNNNNINHKI